MTEVPFTDELNFRFDQYRYCGFGHGPRLPARHRCPVRCKQPVCPHVDAPGALDAWCPICGMHPFEHGPPRPPTALRGIRL